MSKNELRVERNDNYTISLIDKNGHTLSFRDITGNDLEFLDRILECDDSDVTLNFDDINSILSRLVVGEINFYKFPRRIIRDIFNCIVEHILCNYIKKYNWLEACYGIQNGSFVNLSEMEKVPMTKFMAMVEIHKSAIDSIQKDSQ